MNRRTFLRSSVAVLGGSIAGCIDDESGGQQSNVYDLGDAVVRKNLKIGVLGYSFIDKFVTYDRQVPRNSQSFNAAEFRNPLTSGAQFLLVFVVADHEGTSRQYIPSGKNDTNLYYESETVEQHYPQYVFTNGQREFASYYGAVTHAKAKKRGAYPPFTANGFMVFEVPGEFDPEKVEIEITWGWEKGNRGLQNGSSTRWRVLPAERNRTIGEPPTSASHEGQVRTQDRGYETTTEDNSSANDWDTISETYTYDTEDDDDTWVVLIVVGKVIQRGTVSGSCPYWLAPHSPHFQIGCPFTSGLTVASAILVGSSNPV